MPTRQEIPGLFADCLPANCILTKVEQLKPYECDGYTAYTALPLAVFLPEDKVQVVNIVQRCQQENIPIVTRGAGTGLSGGAHPIQQGILLNLSKLNQIHEINHELRYAQVEPGVRNLEISEAAAEFDLYYAPDPSSQIACTIGGNIAENSGGVHCLKYGLTVHNVLEVTYINSQGNEITVGNQCYDHVGYDFLALLSGSEGMLGIIVEAKVRLLAVPENKVLLLAAFADVEHAGNAVAEIIANGVIPAGLEMMDKAIISAAENFCHPGYPADAHAILLCELDGAEDEMNQDLLLVEKYCRKHHAQLIKIAHDAEQQSLYWRGRKSAFPAIGQLTPDYLCMDGTIPRKHLGYVLNQIEQLSSTYDLRVANVFHAGDGNLHPLIMYDANQSGQLERAEQIGSKILELCVAVGGTITGEHGVGIEKLNQMCVQFSRHELDQFKKLKAAFDPMQLLNPGKVIPTLQRCAEFGAIHVHQGNLPFADLPRF